MLAKYSLWALVSSGCSSASHVPYGSLKDEFLGPLFSSSAPRLTITHLLCLGRLTMHLNPHLSALGSATVLRLTGIPIGDGLEDQRYHSFRGSLMVLYSLSHLEIEPRYFGLA